MSSNIEQRPGTGPTLSGTAQLELVRRYARILRSARAETARFDRAGTEGHEPGRVVPGERPSPARDTGVAR